MSEEPENLTLALLRKLDAKMEKLQLEVGYIRDVMTTKCDSVDIRKEITSLRAQFVSDLATFEKRSREQEGRLSDQIGGRRSAATEYRFAAISHGVLLTEFEERLRRLERHVGLPPEGEAH